MRKILCKLQSREFGSDSDINPVAEIDHKMRQNGAPVFNGHGPFLCDVHCPKMLNFLTAHSIMDMAGLDEKFSSMLGEQLDIGDKLKPIERRLPVLKKHLEQYDIYLKFKGKKALSEADKILFKAAHSYLKDVMNGHSTLPVNAWKAEYAKLTNQHKALNLRYLALKNEVKEAEQIRRSVYSILRQQQQPRKEQNLEL